MHQIERVQVEVESDSLKQTLKETERKKNKLEEEVKILKERREEQNQSTNKLQQENSNLHQQVR